MADPREPPFLDAAPPPLESETTGFLLERVRAGDRPALDALLARYLPRLSRWARGRLPRWTRDLSDTHDLVQDTLLRTFKHIERFEPRGDLALQVYLRQAVANRVRDELRRFDAPFLISSTWGPNGMRVSDRCRPRSKCRQTAVSRSGPTKAATTCRSR